MTDYSIEPRPKKYVKGYGFLSFARDLSDKYEETYWMLKNRARCCKSCFKKGVNKTAKITGEFL